VVGVQCARSTWTAHDEDVYRGPFDRRTAAPVLVIGNLWDPATWVPQLCSALIGESGV
jgi:hypothetical protein